MGSQGVDHEKSRVTSPKSSNVWPPCPTVATINLTIVKGRLIHATLLSDRYSWTPENSWIPATFASNKLSTDLLFHQFFFSLSTAQNFSIEKIKILCVPHTGLYSMQLHTLNIFHSLMLQGHRGRKNSTKFKIQNSFLNLKNNKVIIIGTVIVQYQLRSRQIITRSGYE